ncbi:MAG: hypothetical protein H6622_16430 [Halobacteriovoraceae bacterium]|nr:hypothetical protein [Halobacteriovoraceae bacterium]
MKHFLILIFLILPFFKLQANPLLEWISHTYLGVGTGINTLGGFDSAMPLSFSMGRDIKWSYHEKLKLRLDFTYMNLGTFNPSAVSEMKDFISTSEISLESYTISVLSRWQYHHIFPIIFRLGYDVGDDNGIVLGLGSGIKYKEFFHTNQWTQGIELQFEVQKRLAIMTYLVSLHIEIPDFSNT